MDVTKQRQLFENLTHDLPRFDDGRVNFTGARKALVLNSVVYCDGEILLVKRSDKVGAYRGAWNGISGFIDEPKPVEDFARQELSEELSSKSDLIESIKVAEPFEVEDEDINRVWVVYPTLVILSQKPNIVLDWEHTDYKWIKPEQLKDYELVKGFDVIAEKALAQLDE